MKRGNLILSIVMQNPICRAPNKFGRVLVAMESGMVSVPEKYLERAGLLWQNRVFN